MPGTASAMRCNRGMNSIAAMPVRSFLAGTSSMLSTHAVDDASASVRWLQLFDMYRIRLDGDGGEPELAAANPGDVLSWLTDAQFQIRGSAVRPRLCLPYSLRSPEDLA